MHRGNKMQHHTACIDYVFCCSSSDHNALVEGVPPAAVPYIHPHSNKHATKQVHSFLGTPRCWCILVRFMQLGRSSLSQSMGPRSCWVHPCRPIGGPCMLCIHVAAPGTPPCQRPTARRYCLIMYAQGWHSQAANLAYRGTYSDWR